MTKTPELEAFLKTCRARLADEAIVTDAGRLKLLSDDFSGLAVPTAAACVRPASAEDVSYVARAAYENGVPLTARGGGTSYTLTHTPESESTVIVDTRGLNRIVKIDTENHVLTVEAGVTWAQIDQALAGSGLCIRMRGPMSGAQATIGGALGNNAIGAGTWDVAHDLIGVEVVLPDGRIIQTGGRHPDPDTPGFRHGSPNLTGLFVNDAGRMGIRTKASFRLRPVRPATGSAVVRFESFDAGLGGFVAAAKTDRATRLMLLEGWFAAGLLGPQAAEAPCVLLLICDGFEQAGVDAALVALMGAARAAGGKTLPGLTAQALIAMPFLPLSALLQLPDGSNSVPVNAIVPYSKIGPMHRQAAALLNDRKSALQSHGVLAAHVAFAVEGQAAFEVIFGWRSRLDAIRLAACSAEEQARWREIPDNPQADALVRQVRADLVEQVFAPFGAAHAQTGRYYIREEKDPGGEQTGVLTDVARALGVSRWPMSGFRGP